MAASDQGSCHHRQQVDHAMLEGVAIDGGHTHWSCPLMVGLVHKLVEFRMVEQPAIHVKGGANSGCGNSPVVVIKEHLNYHCTH